MELIIALLLQTGLDNGAELFFKVKMNTKLQKVFIVYAQRKGVNVKALRFSFDGERIKDDQTPKVLGMEDQDQLDCFAEQVRFYPSLWFCFGSTVLRGTSPYPPNSEFAILDCLAHVAPDVWFPAGI